MAKHTHVIISQFLEQNWAAVRLQSRFWPGSPVGAGLGRGPLLLLHGCQRPSLPGGVRTGGLHVLLAVDQKLLSAPCYIVLLA